MTKFHDSKTHLRLDLIGLSFTTAKDDGAWSLSLLGCAVWKMHRKLPVQWKVGPWLTGYGSHWASARLVLRSAQARLYEKEE